MDNIVYFMVDTIKQIKEVLPCLRFNTARTKRFKCFTVTRVRLFNSRFLVHAFLFPAAVLCIHAEVN